MVLLANCASLAERASPANSPILPLVASDAALIKLIELFQKGELRLEGEGNASAAERNQALYQILLAVQRVAASASALSSADELREAVHSEVAGKTGTLPPAEAKAKGDSPQKEDVSADAVIKTSTSPAKTSAPLPPVANAAQRPFTSAILGSRPHLATPPAKFGCKKSRVGTASGVPPLVLPLLDTAALEAALVLVSPMKISASFALDGMFDLGPVPPKRQSRQKFPPGVPPKRRSGRKMPPTVSAPATSMMATPAKESAQVGGTPRVACSKSQENPVAPPRKPRRGRKGPPAVPSKRGSRAPTVPPPRKRRAAPKAPPALPPRHRATPVAPGWNPQRRAVSLPPEPIAATAAPSAPICLAPTPKGPYHGGSSQEWTPKGQRSVAGHYPMTESSETPLDIETDTSEFEAFVKKTTITTPERERNYIETMADFQFLIDNPHAFNDSVNDADNETDSSSVYKGSPCDPSDVCMPLVLYDQLCPPPPNPDTISMNE